MARIPEPELERVKREADLVALVRASGVKLKRVGRDWRGMCPFHADTDPSLVVSPNRDGVDLWHCLGACQSGGSAIDWVMRRDGVDFRDAFATLGAGPAASSSLAAPPSEPLPPLTAAVDEAGLLDAVAAHYHARLQQSGVARAYLESRGLGSAALIERFGLGVADRTLGKRLPPRKLKAGADLRDRLEALGVIRSTGHEHLRGSLVIPVRDEAGRVVQLYGRKLRDDLGPDTPKHLYLPGPHRGIWNREALKSPELILCESLIDALTFWAAGHTHVTTAYGTNGFTSELEQALIAHGTERVLLAYDRDDAGDRAAARVAARLQAQGIECYRVQFPRGLDANAYALEVRPAAKSLGLVLRSAEWMGTGPAPDRALAAHKGAPPPATADRGGGAPAVGRASPVPVVSQTPEVALSEGESGELWARLGARRYRIRGLVPDSLKLTLLVRDEADGLHVDTLDLYHAKQRTAFAAGAAAALGGTSKRQIVDDLSRLLLTLEALQIRRAQEAGPEVAPLTDAEREEALALLTDPRLLERILIDFERVGLVGEQTNKLVGYLAAVSRKLPEPLCVIIQSSSAAGKTTLMDAVLQFMPPEQRVQYSALTGQSLFYMSEQDLRHKILAVVEEAGAERASYALKLLQSEGELTIASTGKDPHTGRLITHEYRVEGPVMIMLTTTAVEIDEELLNRALVLTVDEDVAQTRAVHRAQRQRRTLEGLLARSERSDVLRVHHNAQRLLDPVAVVNPYAPELTFLAARTRTRRDHEKYLTLIDTIALLHQHQREQKRVERGGRTLRYIEVTKDDIRMANRLAGEVLGRSLDALPPQTRTLLDRLVGWVQERAEREHTDIADLTFTTRDVRDGLGLGHTQTKVHLARLVELEYVLRHRDTPGQPHLFTLGYQGEGGGGEPFLPGLIDPDTLPDVPEIRKYDPQRSGLAPEQSAFGRPPVGVASGEGRPAVGAANLNRDMRFGDLTPERTRTSSLAAHAPTHVVPAANGTRPTP